MRNVDLLPPEDTATLRRSFKKAWVGAPQLTSLKLFERLCELEGANGSRLKALIYRRGTLRNALANLRVPAEVEV